MKFDFLKSGMQSIGNVFKGGGQQGSNLFSNLQAPQKFNLASGYDTGVLNTGDYSLPTQTNFGQTNAKKPIGDYSFTKSSKDYVPNTEFAQNIANKEASPWKMVLSNGLQTLNEGLGQPAFQTPQIDVTGFNFQNGQINPAQQVKSNLYNFLVR